MSKGYRSRSTGSPERAALCRRAWPVRLFESSGGAGPYKGGILRSPREKPAQNLDQSLGGM